MIRLAGWQLYWKERRAHAETRRLLAHAEAVLADPCPMCLELERERNQAFDERDEAMKERDLWHTAAQYMETIGFGATNA